MNCPKCNKVIKSGDKFCSNCGFPLDKKNSFPPKVALPIDELVSILLPIGVPGLVLVIAVVTSGFYGAAAITTALAAIGGPGGMIGGFLALGGAGLITATATHFGTEPLIKALIKGLIDKGESKESILKKLNGYPISTKMKLVIRDWIERYFSTKE